MPQISVIVPVYKVEKYIHRCVDSILAQTFTDFELILVDDGSPDNCGAICDEYAAKDPRIHVIHQQNGGLSAARNAGIDWAFENSNSEWLTFIDSDDWVADTMLELLWCAARDTNSKIARGFLQMEGRSQGQLMNRTVNVQIPSAAYFGTIMDMSACGKLYAKELFQRLRYPIDKLYEDAFTTYRLFFCVDQIATINTEVYFCEYNMEGITKSGWTPRHLDELKAYGEQIAFFEKRNIDEEIKRIVLGYCNIIHRQYRNMACSNLDELGKRKYRVQLARKMRCALKQYGCRYDMGIKEFPHFFEIAYPMYSSLYWIVIAQWNKLIGKRK